MAADVDLCLLMLEDRMVACSTECEVGKAAVVGDVVEWGVNRRWLVVTVCMRGLNWLRC